MSAMTEAEYVEQRLDDQIGWFDRKSGVNQSRFKQLKVVEIASGAAVPVLVAAGLEVGAAVAGALVTVIAGILMVYRFDETWTSYRATWSALEREKILHGTRSEPYDDEATRFQRLVRRVEAILGAESGAWVEMRSRASEDEQEE